MACIDGAKQYSQTLQSSSFINLITPKTLLLFISTGWSAINWWPEIEGDKSFNNTNWDFVNKSFATIGVPPCSICLYRKITTLRGCVWSKCVIQMKVSIKIWQKYILQCLYYFDWPPCIVYCDGQFISIHPVMYLRLGWASLVEKKQIHNELQSRDCLYWFWTNKRDVLGMQKRVSLFNRS